MNLLILLIYVNLLNFVLGKDVNVAFQFGRSLETKNAFVYGIQSIQYSKIISLNFLEYFITICDSQSIPISYDFSVNNFKFVNQTDYLQKQAEIISAKLNVEYSLSDLIKR